MKNLLIALFFSLGFLNVNYANAQTQNLFGLISNDTTIIADTIKITGDVFVSNGAGLTFSMGAYVEFQDYYKIDIKGKLIAIGDLADTIIFTVKDTAGFADTNTTNGSWGGLFFENIDTANPASVLKYCKFEYGKKFGDTLPEFAGGAIFLNNFSKLLISNSSFSNNLAKKSGGGIYCGALSSPIIDSCVFINNTSHYEGGGIYISDNCNIIVKNSLFYRNKAIGRLFNNLLMGSGGGIYSSSSALNEYCPVISHNKFFNNISLNGGGIYESNYNVKIINNIICNNDGNGIFNGHQLGNGKYINNTICNNTEYGGIVAASKLLMITNNIIYGNTKNFSSDSSSQIDYIFQAPEVSYSNIQYGYAGTGNISTLPDFVSPTNGAGTQFNALNADWSLKNNSACVNNGNTDTNGLYIPLFDILGNDRIVYKIDMGAIENQIMNSIDEISNIKIIEAYPNPASNYFYLKNIQSQIVDLKFYNINGQLISEKNKINPNSKIDIKDLNSGLYIFKVITDGNQVFIGKLIKP